MSVDPTSGNSEYTHASLPQDMESEERKNELIDLGNTILDSSSSQVDVFMKIGDIMDDPEAPMSTKYFIQDMIQQRTQISSIMSNLSRTIHEMAMTAIRNMRLS